MTIKALKEAAERASAVVTEKQPHNAESWYPLIAIKNALYKITDLRDLDLADADAAYIAAANPATVLALIAAVERAEEAMAGMMDVINSAGLHNLVRGVQLGSTSWYVKAIDATGECRAALADIRKLKGEQ